MNTASSHIKILQRAQEETGIPQEDHKFRSARSCAVPAAEQETM